MIATERRNYLIAVMISLIFHSLILISYLPDNAMKSTVLDTYPVGLVELAPGFNPLAEQNGFTAAMTTASLVQPASTPKPSGNPNLNQKNKPAATSKVGLPPTKLPKKEGIAISDRHPVVKPTEGGNPPTLKGEGDKKSGSTGNGQTIGFGNGEGMVTVFGPLPPYPKNAMNEGKEGEVAVRILVKTDGSLEGVNVIKSSGDFRLDKVAQNSVERTWKFKPVTDNYLIDLVFSFDLKTGSVTRKFIKAESRP